MLCKVSSWHQGLSEIPLSTTVTNCFVMLRYHSGCLGTQDIIQCSCTLHQMMSNDKVAIPKYERQKLPTRPLSQERKWMYMNIHGTC